MAKEVVSPKVDFANHSTEYVVSRVLEDQMAFGVEAGVLTKSVAGVMVQMGHPAKDVDKVAREINSWVKKMTGTKENLLKPDPNDPKKTLKFVGATWVGARVGHEPWNQHLLHLPLWQDVNEVTWKQSHPGDDKDGSRTED